MGFKARAQPAQQATSATAYDALGDELGADSGRSALVSRDYQFYRREASLNVADLPHHYWDAVYEKKARAALAKQSKGAEGALETNLALVKARYLKAFAHHVRTAR